MLGRGKKNRQLNQMGVPHLKNAWGVHTPPSRLPNACQASHSWLGGGRREKEARVGEEWEEKAM